MHAETISTALPAFIAKRPRVHVVGLARALCSDLGHFVELCDSESDADWIWPLQAGDAPGPEAGAALADLARLQDAPALIVCRAVRRSGAKTWRLPEFDDRDPVYALAASAGLSLNALIWRGDVWRGLQMAGIDAHPRLAAVRLLETGERIVGAQAVLVERTAGPDLGEDLRGALQSALAASVAISLRGPEMRWPHAPLMTAAEFVGAVIGAGRFDADLLLGAPTLAAATIDDSALAYRFLAGMQATAPVPLGEIASQREGLRADIDAFFDEAIALGAAARPCDAARYRVLRTLIGAAEPAASSAVVPIDIDVSKPLRAIKGHGPRTLLARVHHEGDELDWIQVPTIDGASASDVRLVLRDALERQPTWRIGQLPGVRQGAEFYGSLAFAAARAAPDAALAAGKGSAGRLALARLRTKIIRDAQIARLPSLRAKKSKGRRTSERPLLPPIGSAARIPVLMYHEVTTLDASASRFALPISAFEDQLRWLADEGYQSISAVEWANAIRAGRPVPEKSVLITFDDAYVDFADHAWPALRRNGFWATLYAPAAYIGKAPAWRGAQKGQRIMDARTLRTLADDGCEIGSHAMTHRHLTSIGPEDMLEEAFDSRKILEDLSGQAIETAAYPYGYSDTAVRSAFVMAGYRGGYCAWGGASSLDDDPMNIPRIEVHGDCPIETFISQVQAATHGPDHSAAVASRCAS